MSFQVTTVYADGTTETRNATPEEVAQRDADIAASQTDLSMVRARRNGILASSDWTQLPDAPLTAEKKQEWAEYRQLLRDITKDVTTIDQVVWPDEP